MTSSFHRRADFLRAVFGLSAFGLFVGVLTGMATSPVVASLLGALTTVLVGIVLWKSTGTNSESDSGPGEANIAFAVAAIGWFSLAALVGLLGGVFARTHGLLSPTPADRVAAWTSAGFEATEAREIARLELNGGGAEKAPGAKFNTALFSSSTKPSLSIYLPVVQHGSFAEVAKLFETLGGPLGEAGKNLSTLAATEEEKLRLARIIFDVATEPGK